MGSYFKFRNFTICSSFKCSKGAIDWNCVLQHGVSHCMQMSSIHTQISTERFDGSALFDWLDCWAVCAYARTITNHRIVLQRGKRQPNHSFYGAAVITMANWVNTVAFINRNEHCLPINSGPSGKRLALLWCRCCCCCNFSLVFHAFNKRWNSIEIMRFVSGRMFDEQIHRKFLLSAHLHAIRYAK